MSRLSPPGGAGAPMEMLTATGAAIDLVSLAGEICRRYHEEFSDEHARYGSAGRAWCLHDNQYLLAWSIQEVRDGTVDLVEQVLWLADVLNARGFPLARLARDLEIAAEVAGEAIDEQGLARGVADRLTTAATVVRRAASDDRKIGKALHDT